MAERWRRFWCWSAFALTALMLVGCAEFDSTEQRVSRDIWIETVSLADGRQLTCAAIFELDRSGLSCDWAAAGKGAED